jgi:hypothetical protein
MSIKMKIFSACYDVVCAQNNIQPLYVQQTLPLSGDPTGVLTPAIFNECINPY